MALVMIITQFFVPFLTPQVEAAGINPIIAYPNETHSRTADIFDHYYRVSGDANNPDVSTQGTISTAAGGLSGDGSDIVRLARLKQYLGSVVSKNKINIIQNDFELTFDLSMVNGRNPGQRGTAFAFHNDPRGASALGGEQGNLGIHGFQQWGRNYKPLENALAVEFDPQSDSNVSGTNSKRFDDVFEPAGSKQYGHIAIVRPVAEGGTIEHKATSWVGAKDAMFTGWSTGDTLGYQPTRPPSTQTARVRWTKQADGNYQFSYEYWFNGDTKDIPGANPVTSFQTYTKDEAVAMFGGEEVYFGLYSASDKGDEKWESNFVGFVDMRAYKVGYNFNKNVMQDDGTYKVVSTEVPQALMAPTTGKGLSGNKEVPIAELADVFTEMKDPTVTGNNNPYTPLKDPELKAAGQNYLNDHSFTAFNQTTKKAELFLVPFKDGSTAADKATVHNYIVEVVPKKVDVKIEYVLDDGTTQTVADTVIQTVALGSEVGVTDKKTYTGYALDSVAD